MSKRKDTYLSPAQVRFAEAFISNGGNGTQAAIAAGYSPNTAARYSGTLKKNPKVQDYINKRKVEIGGLWDINAEKVLKELAWIAFGDIKMVCKWGRDYIEVKASDTLAPGTEKLIKKVEFIENEYGDGKNRRFNRKVTVELYDKISALDKIAKCLAMYGGDTVRTSPEEIASKIKDVVGSAIDSALPKKRVQYVVVESEKEEEESDFPIQ